MKDYILCFFAIIFTYALIEGIVIYTTPIYQCNTTCKGCLPMNKFDVVNRTPDMCRGYYVFGTITKIGQYRATWEGYEEAFPNWRDGLK